MLSNTCIEILHCNNSAVIPNGRYSRLTFIGHYYHYHISNIHSAVLLSTAVAVWCTFNFFELFIMNQRNFVGHVTNPKENNALKVVTALSCNLHSPRQCLESAAISH